MSSQNLPPRILVVEDNPNNRRLMVTVLEANQYEVITAEDGKQGVTAAQESIPSLILMDLQMPRLDGYGALAELQRDPATQEIPVLAVSGNATPADRSRVLESGFKAFIAKPFSIDELLKEIQRHLP